MLEPSPGLHRQTPLPQARPDLGDTPGTPVGGSQCRCGNCLTNWRITARKSELGDFDRLTETLPLDKDPPLVSGQHKIVDLVIGLEPHLLDLSADTCHLERH
jgi:hypothetical protein